MISDNTLHWITIAAVALLLAMAMVSILDDGPRRERMDERSRSDILRAGSSELIYTGHGRPCGKKGAGW